MTMTSGDLGVLEDLAIALGVFGADGQPNPNWIGDPGQYLSQMLANDAQRDALLAFADSVLDDGSLDVRGGRTYIPIVKVPDPDVVVGVTFAPAAGHVDIGIYVELATTANGSRPRSETRLEIALFRTRRGSGPAVANPLLLGRPGGRIRLTGSVVLSSSPPPPGAFHLGSVGLSVDVSTASGDGAPSIGLALGQLQMPGGTPRDIDLSADSIDDLDDAVLELVLGLIESQAAGAGGVLGAIAGLIGLRPGLPPLPIDQLASQGVRALVTWLDSILSSPTNRTTWIGHLATLVGGTVNSAGDGVSFTFGIATLVVGIRTAEGTSGQLTIIPFLEASVGSTGGQARAVVDLFSTQFPSGRTVALPRLALFGEIGRSANGAGAVLLDLAGVGPTPAVRVEAVRLGLGLNDARSPVFMLAADRVKIGTHTYPTLDLTSTDALMDAAGSAVDDVVDELLDRLGSFGQAARVLFGLTAPSGHPTVPTITLPALATDPLGALFDYWRTLVTTHRAAVPVVLDMLRQTLATADAATTIAGSGTTLDPWRVPLAASIVLRAHLDATVLHLGIAASTRHDLLGQRCTVIEGDLSLELLTVDLTRRSANVGTGLAATLRLRGRGVSPQRALLELERVTIEADHVSVGVHWSPVGGLRFGFDAPALRVTPIGGIPIEIPSLATLSTDTLDDIAWDSARTTRRPPLDEGALLDCRAGGHVRLGPTRRPSPTTRRTRRIRERSGCRHSRLAHGSARGPGAASAQLPGRRARRRWRVHRSHRWNRDTRRSVLHRAWCR